MNFILATLILASPSWAYIPRVKTILKKTVEKNGATKALVIERKVEIRDENTSAKETWYIAHADLMKVRVSGEEDGKAWSFEILYKGGKRHTLTVQGNEKTFPISSEFYEPLLHYRNPKAMTDKLVRMKILPQWAQKLIVERNPPSQKELVALDRYKGTVSFAFGSQKSEQSPHLWLQQDAFSLQKIRMSSLAEVEFEDYRDHDPREKKELTQPETQVLQWDQATVVIRTTSIKVVPFNKIRQQMRLNKKDPVRLPSLAVFKSFYSRFR